MKPPLLSGREIRVVLLDLTMPRMDGNETFRALVDIEPDVRVILASGYSEQDLLERFPGRRPASVIRKPFHLEALRSTLQKVLSG